MISSWISSGGTSISLRPKPTRSRYPGCTPTATPWSLASATVLRIVVGSPAWKPPATLAEEMYGIISSSKPIFHGPTLSPMSQLMSICTRFTYLSGLAQCLPDLRHLLPTFLAGLVVGLGLGQLVAVRAYDGADGRVAAAGYGVVHQHDGLDPAGDLDGAYRIAEVHHVRRVGSCPRRLLPLNELQLAAPVAVADAVRVRGHRPLDGQELLHALLGQAVAGEPDDHAQLCLLRVSGDMISVHPLANLPVGVLRSLPELQLVALLQRAALVAAQAD